MDTVPSVALLRALRGGVFLSRVSLSRKRRAMSAGFSCRTSAARFISRMSAAEIRPRQTFQGAAHLRIPQQRRRARDRNCFVRREVVAVVFELKEIKTVDQPRRGITGDEIDLPGRERAVAEREIHDLRRTAKSQSVGLRQAGISIRPFHELVTKPRSPFRRDSGRIVDGVEVFRPGIGAADEDRERVVVAERREQRASAVCVELAYLSEHGLRIFDDRPPEDRGQRGAGVLDVDVDLAGRERAVADERAAKIQLASHRQSRLTLDRLRDDLTQNQLLREVLRADDDRRLLSASRARRFRERQRLPPRLRPRLRSGGISFGGASTDDARATTGCRQRPAPEARRARRRQE